MISNQFKYNKYYNIWLILQLSDSRGSLPGSSVCPPFCLSDSWALLQPSWQRQHSQQRERLLGLCWLVAVQRLRSSQEAPGPRHLLCYVFLICYLFSYMLVVCVYAIVYMLGVVLLWHFLYAMCCFVYAISHMLYVFLFKSNTTNTWSNIKCNQMQYASKKHNKIKATQFKPNTINIINYNKWNQM